MKLQSKILAFCLLVIPICIACGCRSAGTLDVRDPMESTIATKLHRYKKPISFARIENLPSAKMRSASGEQSNRGSKIDSESDPTMVASNSIDPPTDDGVRQSDFTTRDTTSGKASDGSFEKVVQYAVESNEDYSANRVNHSKRADSRDVAAVTGSEHEWAATQQGPLTIGGSQRQPNLTESGPIVQQSLPVDFPTVLRLAGADNWNVKIAQQQVLQAQADVQAARSAWLPNLTLGLGYNNHSGEIQATEGQVIDQSRNSLFVGGGLGIANAPLNGGAGGPPRMFVDFSLADAVYQTLSTRRKQDAAIAQQRRVFNDTLLKASLAYFELVQAQAKIAVADQNLADARQLLELTQTFVEAGKGTEADTNRMQVIVNQRGRDILQAQADMKIASAELCTVLQLDPTKVDPESGLYVSDSNVAAIQLVDPSMPLNQLIDQAQQVRCEIAEARALAESAHADMKAEQLRPWLPNLYVGASGGAFGGGPESSLPKLDGRSDVDIVMNWQIRNLGFGTAAARSGAQSRFRQSSMETRRAKDLVNQQVATTFYNVQQYRDSLGLLEESILQSQSALEKNIESIRGLNGLPLEAFQSLNVLAAARTQYLETVTLYNQWQLRLLRATGQPLAAPESVAVETVCNCSVCNAAVPENSDCACQGGLLRNRGRLAHRKTK